MSLAYAREVRSPGDGLLHPVAVAAVILLLMNDHFWKERWPGAMTGKLSDVAGLVFFPLLLQALFEVLQAGARRWTGPSDRVLGICIALTAIVFSTGEILPGATELLEVAWGWARWPIAAVSGAGVRPTVFVRDPTDLLAIPALILPWLMGRERTLSRR